MKRKYRNLIFTIALTHVHTSVENSFLGCDRLPVNRTVILPVHSSVPSPIFRLYIGANLKRLPILLCSCYWNAFFLSTKAQMAAKKLSLFLQEFLGSIRPAETRSMSTKRNSHGRVYCKVTKIHKKVLRTRGYFV